MAATFAAAVLAGGLMTGPCCPVADGQSQKEAGFLISGTVLNLDGSPLPRAHLTAASDRPCSDKGSEEQTEADADGHFQLRVRCAGVWRLSGEATGYPKQLYEQHDAFSTGIVVGAAHAEHDVVFRMVPSSSIIGTVIDEAGDAVRDAKVFLLAATTLGADTLRTVDQTTTDDRGMYEFTDVAAGGYEVAVQVQSWYAVAAQTSRGGGGMGTQTGANAAPIDPSLDVTYPITFYPAATDAASATTIEVAGGVSQEADLHLSPVPSVHVVVPAGGRTTLGFGGGARPMSRGGGGPPIQELTPFGALRFEPTSVSMLPDGSLDVGGFSPGDYAVVEGHSREGLTQQTFTVAKESARTITVGASVARPEPQGTTGTLSGTVVLAQTPCPGALLLLVPISGGSGGVRRQQSNTDGSFRFDDVPLGRYIVVAVDQGWSIDFRDRQTLSAFLMHGVPIDFERSTTMTTPLQAQAR